MTGLKTLLVTALVFAMATLATALLVTAAYVAIERWLERRRRRR